MENRNWKTEKNTCIRDKEHIGIWLRNMENERIYKKKDGGYRNGRSKKKNSQDIEIAQNTE